MQDTSNIVSIAWDRGITELFKIVDDAGVACCGLVDDLLSKMHEQ